MLMKIMTTVLLGPLMFTALGIHSAIAQSDVKTGKIRAKVYKYGIAKKVSVRLRDKSKFKGEITKIENDQFTVTAKDGKKMTFVYSEVDQLKKKGLSKGAWIAIGAAAAGGIILLLVISAPCRNEGGNVFCQ